MIPKNSIIPAITRTTVVAVIVLTTGCAGQSRYAKFQPVPQGSDVHVVAVDPALKQANAKTAGETVGKEAAKGAAVGLGGGLAFGIYSSVLCGPAIIVCAPILVPSGAVVGLIGGTSMGGAKAGREALPKEKAKALEKLMSETFVRTDFSAALQQSFESQGGSTWNLTTEEAGTRITLGVEELDFTQYEDDVLIFNVTTSMIVQYGSEQRDSTRRLLFTHHSSRQPVDYWLADNGKNLRDEMAFGFESTVADMAVSLDWQGRQRK